MADRALRRLAVAFVAAVALTVVSGVSEARADVCASKQSRSTTATICIVVLKPANGTPVSPAPGATVTIRGKTRVVAEIRYRPGIVPGGETRGCGGERRTPSGCITFSVNGGYTLTRLYPNDSTVSGNTRVSTYAWTWHTGKYRNGGRTLTAQLTVNGSSLAVNVPVVLSNRSYAPRSPIPNRGLLPSLRRRPKATGYVVAALGDGPSGSRQSGIVARMVHSWDPGMLMYLGDVYQRGMKEEFLNFYDPLYAGDWPRTLPTVGNHEYKERPDARDYFWHWNYPLGAPKVSGGGGGWYTLRVAGWRIISLNSNVDMSATSPQGTWLASVLARDRNRRPLSNHPCTLAFWHAARFSDISLRLPSTSKLWGQLYPYRADVIVNAHSHAYERWSNMSNAGTKAGTGAGGRPRGITEFVVGTGGNVLAQTWQTNNPYSDFRQRTRWGALKLVLFPGSVEYSYWAAKVGSTQMEMLDSGTIRCH